MGPGEVEVPEGKQGTSRAQRCGVWLRAAHYCMASLVKRGRRVPVVPHSVAGLQMPTGWATPCSELLDSRIYFGVQ
jgi:hypothetical protein